jgi:hypothetical protein
MRALIRSLRSALGLDEFDQGFFRGPVDRDGRILVSGAMNNAARLRPLVRSLSPAQTIVSSRVTALQMLWPARITSTGPWIATRRATAV